VHYVKGNDIRIDMSMEGRSMSIITDRENKKNIFVMHKDKQWMDAKAMFDRMSSMMPNMPGRKQDKEATAPAELNIRPTGEKETIAGHACEHYQFTSEGSEIDICAAKGLGWYFASPGGGGMMDKGRMGPPGNMGDSKVPGLSNAQVEQWKKEGCNFVVGIEPFKIIEDALKKLDDVAPLVPGHRGLAVTRRERSRTNRREN